MLNEADTTYLEGLRTTTAAVLREAIGTSQDVAILDAPNQRNVGDSLIWAGEIAYLERLGLRVRYMADLHGYHPADLRNAMPEGVVLLRGGGDFGDLWPGHQDHRERVVRDLPDFPIVQLPQSILFRSRERAEQANRILGAHPSYTLLIRDKSSLERAKVDLPDVPATYCYDFALGFTAPAQAAEVDPRRILIIARQDREGASGLAAVDDDWLPGADVVKTDWGKNSGLAEARWQAARRVTRLNQRVVRRGGASKLPGGRLVNVSAERALRTLNNINIDEALKLYRRANLVIVDRLHAHVIAGHLGIDHIVLDNSYRKIGAVYDEYTGGLSTARYATSLDEARDMAMAVTA